VAETPKGDFLAGVAADLGLASFNDDSKRQAASVDSATSASAAQPRKCPDRHGPLGAFLGGTGQPIDVVETNTIATLGTFA
jgi:hypothetical protein